MTEPEQTVVIDGRTHLASGQLQPHAARAAALDAVLAALDDAGVRGFLVRAVDGLRTTVGVPPGDRAATIAALGSLAAPGVYVREVYPAAAAAQPLHALSAERLAAVPARCAALEIAWFRAVAGGALTYGLEYGVRIEFWTTVTSDGDEVVTAPEPNAAAQLVDRAYLAPATGRFDGVERPTIALFDRTFVGEVDFPIDAVYTWVDGDEAAWQDRMRESRGDGGARHPAAQAAHRFRSRDELRYSLRSLDSYAPWIRHVYLVTDRQVPVWLTPDRERITVVDHRDLFSADALPLFNSSAIISGLHRIDGLSEHYLYLNDDVFFGRDVLPESFFFGSGIAKVFPASLTRPFLPTGPHTAPQFAISANIRTALEREVGRSISTALKHTPYPQLRSVNAEIATRFAGEIDATARQQFRHHDDIALDQLFHYYAQVIGRAVPSSELTYSYVNVGIADEAVHRLRRLLAARDSDVFCLNDAPDADRLDGPDGNTRPYPDTGTRPVPDAEIGAFLEQYFPLRSQFER